MHSLIEKYFPSNLLFNKYKFCQSLVGIRNLILVSFVVLITFCLQMHYVGTKLYGNNDWRVWSSAMFGGGVPEHLQKQGVQTLFDKNIAGWDSKFHYYIANDLLNKHDTVKSIDAPIYRWQRIGLPLTAKFFSVLLGYDYVTSDVYHLSSLFFFFIALLMFANFITQRGLSVLWILPWAFSPGIHQTLLHGLPDALADSYFLISFIALLTKRFRLYAIFITLAALSRESYILPAFIFFIMAFLGILKKEDKFKIFPLIKFAIPGIIFLSIHFYINVQLFPLLSSSGSLATVSGGILNYPFIEFIKYYYKSASNLSFLESGFLTFYIVTISLTAFGSYKDYKVKKEFLVFIPMIILMSSFGYIVMFHYSGYMKGISILYAILPMTFMYVKEKKYLLVSTCFLLFYVISGFYIGFYKERIDQKWIPTPIQQSGTPELINNEIPAVKIKNFEASFKLGKKLSENKFVNMPLKKLFINDYIEQEVVSKNLSKDIWYSKGNIKENNSFSVTYGYVRKNDQSKVRYTGVRFKLPKDIYPNDDFMVKVLALKPNKKKYSKICVSMMQDGNTIFNKGINLAVQ